MKRFLFILTLLLVTTAMLAAPLKVAFVFVAPIGDGGWSFMHNQGRLYLEKVFGSDIVTDFIENVPEAPRPKVFSEAMPKEVTISFSEQVSATWTAW